MGRRGEGSWGLPGSVPARHNGVVGSLLHRKSIVLGRMHTCKSRCMLGLAGFWRLHIARRAIGF